MLDLKKKRKFVSQCEQFDHSFSGDGSLVAWQLACFSLKLLIFTKTPLQPEPQRNTKEAKTTECMSLTLSGVCIVWRWLDNACSCVYEREIIFNAWDRQLFTSAECHCRSPGCHRGKGSVQLSICALRFARQTVPSSQHCQSQSNSWCLWQANMRLFLYPRWLALSAPKAQLRRTTISTQSEDTKATSISVSFPHLGSTCGLTGALASKNGIIPVKPTGSVFCSKKGIMPGACQDWQFRYISTLIHASLCLSNGFLYVVVTVCSNLSFQRKKVPGIVSFMVITDLCATQQH